MAPKNHKILQESDGFQAKNKIMWCNCYKDIQEFEEVALEELIYEHSEL